MESLEDLYQQLILDSARDSRNRGRLPLAPTIATSSDQRLNSLVADAPVSDSPVSESLVSDSPVSDSLALESLLEVEPGQVSHISLKNPLCGDSIELFVEVVAGRISKVKFEGTGCSISQAAASLMADQIKGLSVEEALQVTEAYQALIKGEATEAQRSRLGDLVALSGVKKFPLRSKCATLSFEALLRILPADSK